MCTISIRTMCCKFLGISKLFLYILSMRSQNKIKKVAEFKYSYIYMIFRAGCRLLSVHSYIGIHVYTRRSRVHTLPHPSLPYSHRHAYTYTKREGCNIRRGIPPCLSISLLDNKRACHVTARYTHTCRHL